ncbi:MAG: DNA-directed DNA polymerase epsilon, subunit B [Trizodia sp. TS-e1964]|nr:MAG: DNA-directed DNA polymerase epsilon, subunit B [Trizodia sp. TS-e1964]
MNDHSGPAKQPPIFHTPEHQAARNPIPSSSPAFGTPAFPIRPLAAFHGPAKSTILPVLLPPPTLRPLAFRTFTKKHNLTLTSSALQGLASFIGKHCGTGWREEGLAEGVLEEIAKSWKKINGGVLVDGENREFKEILKSLEACMSGGRLIQGKSLRRHTSFALGPKQDAAGDPADVLRVARQESQPILALAAVAMDDEEYADQNPDPRRWLKVIDAFAQPRLVYNVGKKHFDRFVRPFLPRLLVCSLGF